MVLYPRVMLGAAGILAKLIDLALAKLTDKKLGDALSDRRRAGRALFGFYDSVSELEELTVGFAEVLERASQHPTGRIFAAWLTGFQSRVDTATKRFEKDAEELLRVIGMYDPALMRLLSGVGESKKGLYHLFASRFLAGRLLPFQTEWKLERERGLSSVRVVVPSKELEWFELDAIYEGLPSKLGRQPAKTDYLSELIKEHLADFRFEPGDTETIIVLKELLGDHAARLARARESLRSFIAARFTLEELLYVQPRRAGRP